MKENECLLGIDVSKLTLDITVIRDKKWEHCSIINSVKSIFKFIQGLNCDYTISIACENTGRYNNYIYQAVADLGIKLYVIHPLHISRSLGLVRGKDDKIDSHRIAQFLLKNREELDEYIIEDSSTQQVKLLLAERRALMKERGRVKRSLNEIELAANKQYIQGAKKRINRKLRQLEKDLIEIENEIRIIIKENRSLQDPVELIQTIPGVGEQLSWTILAKTKGFKRLLDPRKLACYCGVVPFNYQSGTSLKKRPGVSHFADKQLKALLHMSALVSLQHDPEIKKYYNRKLDEGKNKMSVINALRNKILHRICAVLKNQTAFEIRVQY